MTRVRARGEDIRRFIVKNVEKHPSDISKVTAAHFEVTRQAVSKHLQKLTGGGCLIETGQTRNRVYKLAPLSEWSRSYQIVSGLAEDVVWTDDIRTALGQLPENVMNIWQHGFEAGAWSLLVDIRYNDDALPLGTARAVGDELSVCG